MITFKQFLAEDALGKHGEYVNDVAEKTMVHAIINQLFNGRKTEENYNLVYSFIEAPVTEMFYEKYYNAFAEKAKASEAKRKGELEMTLSPATGKLLGEFKTELPKTFNAWKKLSEDRSVLNT